MRPVPHCGAALIKAHCELATGLQRCISFRQSLSTLRAPSGYALPLPGLCVLIRVACALLVRARSHLPLVYDGTDCERACVAWSGA